MSKDRLKGYLDALKQNNIPINKNIIVEAENFTESLGFKAMEKILKKEIPNIVITAEDLLAVGANKYLNEKMVKDIKIIGFNNTPITQYQNPPISSIDINSRQLGYEAAKLLINFLNGTPLKEKHKMVKTKFIER